ncbi:MAG: acetyl-CoA carboxylase biotin carboxyl carrier protein [Phycisphaeraceae bacterium]|nr:acetyl-CoA carboxylase biotin carboxyl carrier protein [Phycisphaerae bacterium]MBX3392338.1 acetyl-CoA carboxylase biotin carboxyl carrier protein [Phycisphaeraceae bacterium]
MIDTERLKELVKLMVENDLTELDLQDETQTVTLKRGHNGVPMTAAPMVHARPAAGPMGEAQAPAAEAPKLADPTAGQVAIESPMVGTFYSSPNPDAAPFVKIGQTVTPDTVVCLIEAMKVFNEIKAEKSGVIEQILVKSGQAVEFGQKLFLIRPS